MVSETALALAARLRRREVSSVELTRACLDAIARDGNGCFIDVSPRSALREAARADELIARGAGGPFTGVPTGIKDHEPVRGTFTRLGSSAFRYLVSPVDGAVARTCRRAGFVLVGKTSTSELTILPFVDTALGPPTRNPHDPSRYAGGSSGGAAAAVASDLIAIAPGSDGGGSIRIPAAFCGLVGVKPTRGAVPSPYGMFDPIGISHLGPIAKTVRDAVALLDVLGGARFGTLLDASLPPLAIRILRGSPLVAVDRAIADATDAVARRLADMGHRVSDIGPMPGAIEDFLPVMARMLARVPLLPGMDRLLQPATRWLRAQGTGVTASDARAVADRAIARMAAWWGDADVIVSPTVAQPPPHVGAFAHLGGEATFRAAADYGAFTAPFNLTGQPALTIPVGPMIGVQLVGRMHQDRLLLALADRLT